MLILCIVWIILCVWIFVQGACRGRTLTGQYLTSEERAKMGAEAIAGIVFGIVILHALTE